MSTRVIAIDSHTGGEPTRVIVAGGPNLGAGPLSKRREQFRDEHDEFRSAVINEPRGWDVLVGALLCEPTDPTCAAGVVFFNNVGVLNMCGHGTIGIAVTLAHQGKIRAGVHRLETPVGLVTFTLHEDLRHVSIENVPSYRHRTEVGIDVSGYGTITGDVAWGGNWFFLVGDHGQRIESENVEQLTQFTVALKQALVAENITGEDGGEIDHIELIAESDTADARNFVLCPGAAWDRSPCGTGTSAKVACLAADGKLQPGEVWRQESLIGTQFEATYRLDDAGCVVPIITGSAYITAEIELIFEEDDPFRSGIRR